MLTIISSHEKHVSEKRKKDSNSHLGIGRVLGKGYEECLKHSEKYAQVKNASKTPNGIQLRLALPTGRKAWKDSVDRTEQGTKERVTGNIHTSYVCFGFFFHIGFTTFLRKFNLVALF